MAKKTVSKEIYTACVGIMYVAKKHYAEAEDGRKVLAALLAEETHEADGTMLAELKSNYGDYASDVIYGLTDSMDAVEAVEMLFQKLGIQQAD